MEADNVMLGMEVTFKKYGALQSGRVTAAQTTESVRTLTVLGQEGHAQRKETSRTKFRVEFVMRNGNEAKDWMYAHQFAALATLPVAE